MPFKYLPSLSDTPEWGNIAGLISSQSDLSGILDSKSDLDHNHNLASLNEKSYNNLDDKPNLDIFLRRNEIYNENHCYQTDGVDDYLKITDSPFVDILNDFTLIIRAQIIEYAENLIICSKLDTSNYSGWELKFNYGVPKFSVGNGTAIFTVNHSKTVEEGISYNITISYDDSEKRIIFGIDDQFDDFILNEFGSPAPNTSDLIISATNDLSDFFKISIQKMIIISRFLSETELLELIAFSNNLLNQIHKFKYDLNLLLIDESCGTHYWFDHSGNNCSAKIFGGLDPNYKSRYLILPIGLLSEDDTFSGVIPAGYSIDYVYLYNHSSEEAEISVECGGVPLIENLTLNSDTEYNISINKMFSIFDDSELQVLIDGTDPLIEIILTLTLKYPVIQ